MLGFVAFYSDFLSSMQLRDRLLSSSASAGCHLVYVYPIYDISYISAEAQRLFCWRSPIRLDRPAFRIQTRSPIDRFRCRSVCLMYLYLERSAICDLHGSSARDWGTQHTDSLHRVYWEAARSCGNTEIRQVKSE